MHKAFLLAAASFIPHAVADFHLNTVEILDASDEIATYETKICPSNYFNCKCYGFGDREGSIGHVNDWGDFSIEPGLCGMGKIDVYPDGDSFYRFYIAGGDGTEIGYCTPDPDDYLNCWTGAARGTVTVNGGWYCHSYVCN